MNGSTLGSYDCSALMVIVSARKEKLLWGRIPVGYQPEPLTTAFNRMSESQWDINSKVLKVIRILSLLGMGATKNRSNSRSITAHEMSSHFGFLRSLSPNSKFSGQNNSPSKSIFTHHPVVTETFIFGSNFPHI